MEVPKRTPNLNPYQSYQYAPYIPEVKREQRQRKLFLSHGLTQEQVDRLLGVV